MTLLLIAITLGLALISALISRSSPGLINTGIGLALFGLVFFLNRGGRIGAALVTLLVGGVLAVIVGATVVGTPIPIVYYLGALIGITAAFGRPGAPLRWAAVLSVVPWVINLILYGSLLAPASPIILPDGTPTTSVLVQELIAISLFWMLAGTAYLSSHLVGQLLGESQAATAEALAANQALRASEERFARVFHASPIAILITALADGRIIDANASFLQLTGHSRDEILGRTTVELDMWEDPPARARVVDALRERGALRDFESTYRVKSGAIREGLMAIETIEIGGQPCIVTLLIDITERKQAEAALRRSEERFSRVFHASPIAITLSRFADGLMLDVNPSYLELMGCEREDVVGKTAAQLGVWAEPGERDRIVEMLRERPTIHNRQIRYRTKAGAIREALASYELIELAGEQCIVSMFQDITDRNRAEAALRESEERFRLIAENTGDLIVLFDDDNRIVYASPSHRAILGMAPDDVVGRRGVEFVHPDDIHAVLAARMQLRPGNNSAQATFRYRHADGSWRWIEAIASLTQQRGRTFLLSVGRDITERRMLEARLLQSQKMESVGRLAGGVAHDFNNLLTAIGGYADLALSGVAEGDPIQADLEEIRRASERAAALTRQLLAFARRQIIEPRVLDLNGLLADADLLLQRLIGEDIELVRRLAPSPQTVRADPHQIEQVIINLAVNARDAMPNGGQLTLETATASVGEGEAQQLGVPPGSYALLVVSDTGTGFAPEATAHQFEPFFTTKEPGKGTGLGLATSYGIVKQHGGHIEIHSEQELGTTVRVYLPRVEQPAEPQETQPGWETLPGGSEAILLVEDEAAVRELAVRVLRGLGYRVSAAADAEEALQITRGDPGASFDLLLTDVVMPRMSGRALAAQVAALCPGIKVLFTSGYTGDPIVRNGQIEPGLALLPKPFSPRLLARKVREVLESESGGQ